MFKNQVKAGAILSYVSLILTNIITILYTPFLLRMLGKSEYGLYSLTASIIAYLTILDFGLGNAVVRYIAKYKSEKKEEEQASLLGMFLVLYTCISILSLLGGFVLYCNIEVFFGESMSLIEIERAKIMLIILLLNIAINFPLSVFWSVIIAYERFVFQKVLGIIRIIIQPLIMIPLLLWGYKAIAMVVVMTLVNIFCLFVDTYYCFKVLKIKIYFKKFNWKLFKEIGSYSYYVFLAFLADKLYINSGQFVLGIFIGTGGIAIYSVAIQIRGFYSAISSAMTSVVFPKVVNIITLNASNDDISNFFIKIGRIQYFICGLIVLGFVLFGKNFVLFWAGPEYADTFLIASIIIVPLTFSLIQSVGVLILQAMNQLKFRTYSYTLVAVLGVCASIPMTIWLGGVGCAIALSTTLFIGDVIIINIYYHKKTAINISLFWKEILQVSLYLVIPFILGLLANIFIEQNSFPYFILKLVIYTISYISVVYLFCLNQYEKGMINSFINKFSK